MAQRHDYHRYLGVLLFEFFRDTPFDVDLERDVSVQKQLLDILVIRSGGGPPNKPLPDGLENLEPHNLVTFKSIQESLDDFAIKELVGHCVNYRKQEAQAPAELLPEEDVKLYAIAARYPRKLAVKMEAIGQPLRRQKPGVYDLTWGTDTIRLIVIREMEISESNAVLGVLCKDYDRLRAVQQWYIKYGTGKASTVVAELLGHYHKEGTDMPIDVDAFVAAAEERMLERMSAEKRLRGLTPEERVRGLTEDEMLRIINSEPFRRLTERQQQTPTAEK